MIDLDPEGVPGLEPTRGWLDLLGPGDAEDLRASRWLLSVLRYSRADGSPVFGPVGRSPSRLKALGAWANRLGDPSLSSAVSGWLPSEATTSAPSSPPPPASDSRPDRVLAILRPDWAPRGDLLAIDHRRPGDETLVELGFRGRTWIGPSWTSGASPAAKASPARPTRRTSGLSAECSEWSYKLGPRQVTRSVVLLKGRSMALIGQQVDGREPSSEIRLDLAAGVEASTLPGSRALVLTPGKGRPAARLLPLGLPGHDRPTDLGSIAVEGRQVVVRQAGEGRRRWLPVLVCWGRPPTGWRPCTVAFRAKACRGDVASAVRVAWGPRDEGLVVYRSLGPPALRSFLGHQTGSTFLVGAFTPSGDVRPLLKADP